jgi:hypothetical protein
MRGWWLGALPMQPMWRQRGRGDGFAIWHIIYDGALCCTCRCLVCGMVDSCHWKRIGGNKVVMEDGIDVHSLWEVGNISSQRHWFMPWRPTWSWWVLIWGVLYPASGCWLVQILATFKVTELACEVVNLVLQVVDGSICITICVAVHSAWMGNKVICIVKLLTHMHDANHGAIIQLVEVLN